VWTDRLTPHDRPGPRPGGTRWHRPDAPLGGLGDRRWSATTSSADAAYFFGVAGGVLAEPPTSTVTLAWGTFASAAPPT